MSRADDLGIGIPWIPVFAGMTETLVKRHLATVLFDKH